jgi:hypothetical protein
VSSELFDRRYSLVIGPTGTAAAKLAGALDVSDLRFAFTVKKTLKWEPNTAEFHVWNLNRESRLFLENPGKLVARLEAGYASGVSQIYLGEVRAAESATDGPDVITTISTGDGLKEIQAARINVSFGPETPVDVALRAIANTLGVGLGNVDAAATRLKSAGHAPLFAFGGTISGHVRRELTDFCNSAGLEWSIQDGQLQVLDRGRALEGQVLDLSADSGLVGSPTVDSKGVASAVTLMIPDLRPGVVVNFDARHLKGAYRVIQCEYAGDTHGQEWGIKLHGKKY